MTVLAQTSRSVAVKRTLAVLRFLATFPFCGQRVHARSLVRSPYPRHSWPPSRNPACTRSRRAADPPPFGRERSAAISRLVGWDTHLAGLGGLRFPAVDSSPRRAD